MIPESSSSFCHKMRLLCNNWQGPPNDRNGAGSYKLFLCKNGCSFTLAWVPRWNVPSNMTLEINGIKSICFNSFRHMILVIITVSLIRVGRQIKPFCISRQIWQYSIWRLGDWHHHLSSSSMVYWIIVFLIKEHIIMSSLYDDIALWS